MRDTTAVGLIWDQRRHTSSYVVRYVDSDFASHPNNRRSLTCYILALSSCAISWKVILQLMSTFSTTKEEGIAVANIVKEAIC